MVKEISSSTEYKSAISQSGLVVVDWYAVWCKPCLAIAPKIEDLSKTWTSVKFYKVNVDDLQDVAQSADVSAMPTFHFFKDGKLVDKIIGANLPSIKIKVEQYA